MYALAIFVETYQRRVNQDNKDHYPETDISLISGRKWSCETVHRVRIP